MKIDRLILGAFETNCYILRHNQTAKDCLIIDTSLEIDEPVNFLQANKLEPKAVILTHGHADHIAGISALRARFCDIKVCVHKLDAPMLTGDADNLSALAGEIIRAEPADLILEAGDIFEQAGIKLKVLHTPGHSQGGVCLYSKDEGIVFSGDTLFAESVGRTDMTGGSMVQLIKSIKESLLPLPDETIVYPGHGPSTTMGQEKTYNQYLQ